MSDDLPWERQTCPKRAATLAATKGSIGSIPNLSMCATQFVLRRNPAAPQRVPSVKVIGDMAPENRHVVPMRKKIIHVAALAVKAETTYGGLLVIEPSA